MKNIFKMFKFQIFNDYSMTRYVSNILVGVIFILVYNMSIDKLPTITGLWYMFFIFNSVQSFVISSKTSILKKLKSLNITYTQYYIYQVIYAFLYGSCTFAIAALLVKFDVIRISLAKVSLLELYYGFVIMIIFIFMVAELVKAVRAIELKGSQTFMLMILILPLIILTPIFALMPFGTIENFGLTFVYHFIITLIGFAFYFGLMLFISRFEIKNNYSKMEVFYEKSK